MLQHGCNNLPLIIQQQNVGEGGGKGGEGTTKQSKSKEGVGGLRSFPSQRGGLEV